MRPGLHPGEVGPGDDRAEGAVEVQEDPGAQASLVGGTEGPDRVGGAHAPMLGRPGRRRTAGAEPHEGA